MAHRGIRGPRQVKSWLGLPSTQFSMTAVSTTLVGTLSPGAPFTVLRILGEYSLSPTNVTVSGDGCEIGVGIGVVSTDAATLGSSAMPDPLTEAAYPWLYWASHGMWFPSATSGAAGEGPQGASASFRKVIDIRSMRKLKNRESLVLVVEYVDRTGLPPVEFNPGTFRVLLGQG